MRKIVATKEGTANLANIDGYEIGGKTGTANKSFDGNYTNKKVNTFVSIFPTTKPKFILAVMLDEPQINEDYIYAYRDGSGFKLKGVREIQQDGIAWKRQAIFWRRLGLF